MQTSFGNREGRAIQNPGFITTDLSDFDDLAKKPLLKTKSSGVSSKKEGKKNKSKSRSKSKSPNTSNISNNSKASKGRPSLKRKTSVSSRNSVKNTNRRSRSQSPSVSPYGTPSRGLTYSIL